MNIIIFYQKNLEFLKINKTFPILRKVLILLTICILFFCLLHIYAVTLSTLEFAKNEKLKIHDDGGYAEIFQYLQFLTVSIVTLILYNKRRKYIYVIWSLFFITLLADDAFRIHEVVGELFAETFNVNAAFGLRAVDFGELAVAGALGLFFAVPILLSLFKGGNREKFITMHFILLVSVLLFFGIVVDMLHSFLNHLPGSGVLSLVEDGGEMLAGSLLVWYSLNLYLKSKEPVVTPKTIKVETTKSGGNTFY